MLLPKKKDLSVKKENKKGYNLLIDRYIKTFKENNLKIENIEIVLNERGEMDLKIQAKEKKEG